MSRVGRKNRLERRERETDAARIKRGLAGVWLRHVQKRVVEKLRRKTRCVAAAVDRTIEAALRLTARLDADRDRCRGGGRAKTLRETLE